MMKKILFSLIIIGISLIADDWPFACEQPYVKKFSDNRYFEVSSNDLFPLSLADSHTINIDRKNKIIKAWAVELSSEKLRQEYITDYGSKYSDFGFIMRLFIIDYQSMRFSIADSIEYNCDGSTIEHIKSSGRWDNIGPGTVMESKMNTIMNRYNLKLKVK